MAKKILVIAEGPSDRLLMKRLFQIFSGLDVCVVCFKTNIYQLYESYESYNQPYQDLDVQNVLLETRKDNLNQTEKNILRDQGYSETLLVFDFDPHDPCYDKNKIKKLMTHFDDSSNYGRLFINYPMLESFQHIDKKSYTSGQKDENFLERNFSMKDLTQYKSQVSKEGFRLSSKVSSKDSEQIRRNVAVVIKQHLDKVKMVTEASNVDQETLIELLERQNTSVSRGTGHVINTSCLIIYDLYPSEFKDIE